MIDTSYHFNNFIFILWIIYLSISQSYYINNSKQPKFLLKVTSSSSNLLLLVLKLHFIYLILILLNLKFIIFKNYLHISSLEIVSFTLLSINMMVNIYWRRNGGVVACKHLFPFLQSSMNLATWKPLRDVLGTSSHQRHIFQSVPYHLAPYLLLSLSPT